LPLWLSPLQGIILPIKKDHLNYALKILNLLKSYGFRFEIWMNEESLSKRILLAEEQKIPLVLICGDKEVKNKTLSLRIRKKGDLGEKKLEDIISLLNEKGNPPS
jgi:threonyl-tRNA synthetase